jgi:hypothetical protein
VSTSNPAQVPGRIKVNRLYFAGGAVGIDGQPNGVNVAPIDFEFDITIFESAVAPYVRFSCPAGVFNGIVFRDAVEADSIAGYGTAVLDAQNSGNILSVLWTGGSVGTISAAANDRGAITQSYAAGASLTVAVQTAAAGCATSPADANVIVQYRMQ